MDMADIIAAHNVIFEPPQIGDYGRVEIPGYFYCQCCAPDTCFDSPQDHAAHVAEELTKAGYGSIQESKAKVWDEAYWTGVDDADIASGYTTDDFGVPGGGPIRPARINPYLLKAA